MYQWDELWHTHLPNPPSYMYSGLAPNEDAPDNRAIPGLRRCIGQGFLAQHHTTDIDDMATMAHQSFEKQLVTFYKAKRGHKPGACGFPMVVLAPRKRKNAKKNLKRERGLEENRVRSIPRALRRCLEYLPDQIPSEENSTSRLLRPQSVIACDGVLGLVPELHMEISAGRPNRAAHFQRDLKIAA
ncbi:hypothetical protein B0H13DRAFT_1861646 [Mycena leptocephala]|nr:hypothetical protein B0H13DRAFT_1861646 [Mycena leptocephala]